MALAKYANAPVLLVGDIDRGGIFAQLIGTALLLDEDERQLLKGFVVNKFRGDMALFYDGVHILEEKGHVPVLGIVPYLHDLMIPEEDAVVLEEESHKVKERSDLDIAVIHLPRIANFDDFDALEAEKGVRLRFVGKAQDILSADAVIIPGTKSSINDLVWLRAQGIEQALKQFADRGGHVVGICGGYQMLGERLCDPEGVESSLNSIAGLGLLPFKTAFAGEKATYQMKGIIRQGPKWLERITGKEIEGYEIHMGRTESASPWLEIVQRNGAQVRHMDGAASADGKIWGCYIHGIFNNEHFRKAWLNELGLASSVQDENKSFAYSLARLADSLESHLDIKKIERIIWAS